MPDLFTEVTKTGYFNRLSKSFGGIILGIILFFGSFVVLYNNEGSIDYSEIAKTAVEVSSTKGVDPSLNDKLLVTNGTLTTTETLTAKYIKPASYLALNSNVEMYAWIEESKSSSESEVGGSEKTTTTYTYKKGWTKNPEDSSRFRIPEGHTNTTLPFEGTESQAESAKLGVFDVDMRGLTLPSLQKLTLNSENTDLPQGAKLTTTSTTALTPATTQQTTQQGSQQSTEQVVVKTENTTEIAGNNYIFLSKNQGSSFDQPQVGDVRISYTYLPNNSKVTLFGKLTDNTFGSYVDKNSTRFYQAFSGTKEDAIISLHQAYVTSKWIMRFLGFIMMWIGLSMILGPLSVLVDVLPLLGSISKSLVGFATFIVALVLSTVTILISIVFHNVVALIFAVLIVGGITFTIFNNKKTTATTAPPSPPTSPSSTSV
jgi:hypothetical protein